MTTYHVNPTTGNPGVCKAIKECPFGSPSEHYPTKDEARAGYEKQQAELGTDHLLAAFRKNPKIAAMEEQVEWTRRKRAELEDAYHARGEEVSTEYREAPLEDLQTYNLIYRVFEEHLTRDEKDAFDAYTGLAFDPVNKYLRDREGFIAENRFPDQLQERIDSIEKMVKHLDSALEKAPKMKRTLFRRLDQDTSNRFVSSEEFVEQLGYTPGSEVEFTSFSSTTIDAGYVARTGGLDENVSIVLKIDTDKGAPVGYTPEARTFSYTQEAEREVLLPRNVRFRVTGVERARYLNEEDYPAEVLTVSLEEI